jgi:hypothetical protein
LAAAAALLGRAHCVVGQAVDRASGPGSLLRFPLPVALPPDGTYPVEVGPVHATAIDRAAIAGGSVWLEGTPPTPWVRVAFPG